MYKEAKEWKSDAGLIAKSEGIEYFEKEDIIIGKIYFYLKYPRDIQGSLKLLFDSLEGVYYKNDKQVIQFGPVYKFKSSRDPRIELFIN